MFQLFGSGFYIMVMHDPKSGFRVANVKFESSSRALVAQAGLTSLLKIFDTTDLGRELAACLPEDGSNRSTGNYKLGLLLIAGLLSGHDCIDDIEEFEDDELLISIFGGSLPTAKTMGNFLRRFEPHHIARLKLFLTKMGYTLRSHTRKVHPHKGENIPHFKIDSTTHEQHGRQMEGCGWIKMSDDKSIYGYASQTIFDELGFCYAGELLTAAHPRGEAKGLLNQVLSPLRGEKIENPFEKVADVSGDSAYLTEDVIRSCQSHHATFTIAAPRTIQWHEHIDNAEWTAWAYTPEQMKKWQKKKSNPPECWLTRWHWKPGWAEGKLMFPVIVKKQWRDDEVMGQACGSWHYHAVATSRDLSLVSYQSVIEAYRPRAEMENQIKEFKINFDAKHFPCLKMSANEVYFLFVLISQNLIRWAALLDQPDKPHYGVRSFDWSRTA